MVFNHCPYFLFKYCNSIDHRFECCGRIMVTVIIKGKAACVMLELELIGLLRQSGNIDRKIEEKQHK